ncbi:hypothetical protein KGG72_gp80 [Streptomyces phage Salutena]|uniref:Uncharacterized protein n=1 Tax=Streptomyces phage Salutena TaxID=2767576 RepID=A0A7S6U3L6_9CAUD|nr:hypothetical protein KGG72_gp80 [Streptomyces phage Salutena]QOV06210.1 hypothetical protein CPT_Salutena_080 [Streptomyces phage Salutena]
MSEVLETLFMAPTMTISCKCGELYAAYENGHVIKLRDSSEPDYEGMGGVWLGRTLHYYTEDPECTACFGDLIFTAI